MLLYMQALHAGRAEQICAKARMAYRAITNDIDERGFAGIQSALKGRAKFLGAPYLVGHK